jgi:hypothetical protein
MKNLKQKTDKDCLAGYIPAWKVGLGTLVILALTVANEYKQGKRFYEYVTSANELLSKQIDSFRDPVAVARDIDGDGRDDLIMKLKSGEDFILYSTEKGYQTKAEINWEQYQKNNGVK